MNTNNKRSLARRLIGWPSLSIFCVIFSLLAYCFLSRLLRPASASSSDSHKEDFALYLMLLPGFVGPLLYVFVHASWLGWKFFSHN